MAGRDFLNESSQSDYNYSSPRDFLMHDQEESLGEAAQYAIPRMAADILSSTYQGIQNIPARWEQAKTEVPGFLNPLNYLSHPIERGKQSLAGLLELGEKINRAPKTLANYAANRLHLIPQEWANKIPVAPSLDEDIEKYIGKPQYPGDALSRGIARNADLLAGGESFLNSIPHLTKKGATRKLRQARKLEEERDIGTLNVNPELIEDARQYLPNNFPERSLLNASQSGDYNSLFKLQSDVGKISAARTGKIKSLFSPEAHLKGQAGLESRNRLLDAIHENLQSMGHNDISDLLRKGQNDFRRYKKLKKYRNMLGGAGIAYAVPKNPLTDLLKKLWSHGD